MNKPLALVVILVMCALQLLLTGPEAVAQSAQSGAGRYGTVHFSISCRPGAQEQFERAVAMLHSFFYPENVKAFEAILAADPDCAMAYWGLAISQRPNPLVPPWARESLKRGLEAVQKGKARGQDRARARLARRAGAGLRGLRQRADHGPQRALRSGDGAAGRKVRRRQGSGDLLRAGAAGSGRSPRQDVRQADQGGRHLGGDRRAQPDHPGWRTTSSTATTSSRSPQRGVPAADKYAKVAPSAPHAQHMPSHIYSILGRWDDSIRSNQASGEGVARLAARNAPGDDVLEEPHAQDFMAYAYLQLGQNREAKPGGR